MGSVCQVQNTSGSECVRFSFESCWVQRVSGAEFVRFLSQIVPPDLIVLELLTEARRL